jgi:hypothetical protein
MNLPRIDLEIGEKFKYKDKNIVAVESDGTCSICCLRGIGCLELLCVAQLRKDKKDVVFIEVEE